MDQTIATTGPATPFYLVGGVNTQAAIPGEISFTNVPGNIARGHPKVQSLPGWNESKGSAPIALIGGGPSLEQFKHQIADFPVTVACGSSHDWMMRNGFTPTWCVVCDPDPVSANYLTLANDKTVYMVATQCDPKVFQALVGRRIFTWHCYPFNHDEMKKLDPEWGAVGGGCTVGLRSLGLAILFGYRNVHFFGFDSCLGVADKPYAYDLSTPEEAELTGQSYEITANRGDSGPRAGATIYRCAGYQLGQAQHFKELFINYGPIIEPTFHGPGLMADWTQLYLEGVKYLKDEIERQQLEQANGICG